MKACRPKRRKEKKEREHGREDERQTGREGVRDRGTEAERQRGREAPSPLAPLFVCFFFFPLSLPYVNWASQECCLLYLRSSLLFSDLPLFYF